MPTKTIHSSCFKALSKYRWPGNIRELTNTLERMLIMGAEMLTSEDVPTDIAKDDSHISGELSLKAHRDNMERHIILERLKNILAISVKLPDLWKSIGPFFTKK
jgi:transcriptional regulator with PAS, ATPase and Fis domain